VTQRASITGVAASHAGRVIVALLMLAVASLVLAGCHDEERLLRRLEEPPARLPVEPNQPDTPPAPALLDTVRDWQQPKRYAAPITANWPLVTLIVDDDYELTYRVPFEWTSDKPQGQATNGLDTVFARASVTQLNDTQLSLATYAAQLAEGAPIFQFASGDGHVVYVTRREVALAPTDPDALREVFHTSVVSIDGHIVKLDVRYPKDLDWRYDELSSAITGTLQVRRR